MQTILIGIENQKSNNSKTAFDWKVILSNSDSEIKIHKSLKFGSILRTYSQILSQFLQTFYWSLNNMRIKIKVLFN